MFPGTIPVKILTQVEDFVLGVRSLSALGTIVTELVTNIMKHTYTGRNDGILSVSASLEEDCATVIVENNGIGLTESMAEENMKGFGFTLVKALAQQLDGSISIERREGTRMVLRFRFSEE